MSLLEKLSINKKITAFFADGTQRMNLGVGTAVDLLKGTEPERVPVQIAPVKTFFNGSPQGQILSVYKTRESNPQQVADFKAALENGDCTWGDTPFSKAVVEKAAALGIEVPENLVA